jgi:hypothetical protein
MNLRRIIHSGFRMQVPEGVYIGLLAAMDGI